MTEYLNPGLVKHPIFFPCCPVHLSHAGNPCILSAPSVMRDIMELLAAVKSRGVEPVSSATLRPLSPQRIPSTMTPPIGLHSSLQTSPSVPHEGQQPSQQPSPLTAATGDPNFKPEVRPLSPLSNIVGRVVVPAPSEGAALSALARRVELLEQQGIGASAMGEVGREGRHYCTVCTCL